MRFLILLLFSIQLSAQAVYKTPAGAKYHLSTCRMVKNVSSSIALEDALKSGLIPCKICRPPFRKIDEPISPPRKVAGVNSPNQCHAQTKAGSRCKRTTKIGNDFCYQHLP